MSHATRLEAEYRSEEGRVVHRHVCECGATSAWGSLHDARTWGLDHVAAHSEVPVGTAWEGRWMEGLARRDAAARRLDAALAGLARGYR